MAFDIAQWSRYHDEGLPVYVRGERPSWFVPNSAGDDILRRLAGGNACGDARCQRFLARLPDVPGRPYPGRAALLSLDHLREMWFHVTNRCNLACRHCLFASSPKDTAELPTARVLTRAAEASRLGCRVFALTGGEPFIHPGFTDIVDGLLALPDSHVVVLTNGMLFERTQAALARWDPERVHFQISLDGLESAHNHIRGEGTFAAVSGQFDWLKARDWPFTVSMCVQQDNVADMPGVVRYAAERGAATIHFMWYVVRGRGRKSSFALPDIIEEPFKRAVLEAEQRGVGVDNIDALKTQVFAPPGTIHDGSNAAWESLAIGPEETLFPTPAMVGIPDLEIPLDDGLDHVWRNSEVLERLRQTTARDSSDPFRFLLGGGDPDHCHAAAGSFTGDDPYEAMHRHLALWLITREARKTEDGDRPGLRLKMGDRLESCGAHGSVALVHSNCLLSLAHHDTRTVVKEFYTDAATATRDDILNPACYPEEVMAHIPTAFRFRGYGCGSPVLDARLMPGERVVDLGCGTGMECFVAAKMVGPLGDVIGVDMLNPMLRRATEGAKAVAESLGYDNLRFEKGYLEQLPLEDASADAILSNCVVNLSGNKRRVFAEIMRILRPGGRLVISDVVCDQEPDAAIRNDDALKGECIAGALTQKDLFGMLAETGFEACRIINRLPYRVVRGHPFFSLTFEACRGAVAEAAAVIYPGPFAAVITQDQQVLAAGVKTTIRLPKAFAETGAVLALGDDGSVTNVDQGESCCCTRPPEAEPDEQTADGGRQASPNADAKRHADGCMLCGAALRYLASEEWQTCEFCGETIAANAVCEAGHFICDDCHRAEGVDVIRRVCLNSVETDMIALLRDIRAHASIPTHGPEHHVIVPVVILTTARNLGAAVTDADIGTAITRGSSVDGGCCGFMGACGAAIGVGIAFSILLESNPLKPGPRRIAQTATARALGAIAEYEAPRCCQRDCWIALQTAASLSSTLLPFTLKAEASVSCTQYGANGDCLGRDCPVWPLEESDVSAAASD